MIITNEKNLDKALDFFPIWTSSCDNHVFISLISDSNFTGCLNKVGGRRSVKYKDQINVFQPAHFYNDTWKELTTKVYKGFMDVYQHHPGYKWYLKAELDTFIFMENLRDFLSDKTHNQLFLLDTT